MIANSSRLGYEEKIESSYRVRMILTIAHFRKTDVGKYECRCRNEHGEAEGTVKLHGNSVKTKPKFQIVIRISSNIFPLGSQI